MAERIAGQVRTITWDERRNQAEKKANEELFPFERMEYLKLLPYDKNEQGGTEELNKRFKRIDVSGALGMLKKQEGIPFPVPRFALLDLWHDREVSFSFNLLGQENHSHSIESNGKTIIQVPPREARQAITKPILTASRDRYDKLRSIGGILLTIGFFFMLGIIPGFLWAGLWGCLSVAAATTLLIFIGATWRCKAEAEVSEGMAKLHSLKTSPGGFVPDDVRQKVKDEAVNFEVIGLLFEAEWSHKKVVNPSSLDPLVVGYKEGAWYLIADFDLTDKERYVKKELGE